VPKRWGFFKFFFKNFKGGFTKTVGLLARRKRHESLLGGLGFARILLSFSRGDFLKPVTMGIGTLERARHTCPPDLKKREECEK